MPRTRSHDEDLCNAILDVAAATMELRGPLTKWNRHVHETVCAYLNWEPIFNGRWEWFTVGDSTAVDFAPHAVVAPNGWELIEVAE